MSSYIERLEDQIAGLELDIDLLVKRVDKLLEENKKLRAELNLKTPEGLKGLHEQ